MATELEGDLVTYKHLLPGGYHLMELMGDVGARAAPVTSWTCSGPVFRLSVRKCRTFEPNEAKRSSVIPWLSCPTSKVRCNWKVNLETRDFFDVLVVLGLVCSVLSFSTEVRGKYTRVSYENFAEAKMMVFYKSDNLYWSDIEIINFPFSRNKYKYSEM